jgi:hypothetical protein
VPLYKDYGGYPGNATFEGVRVSYGDDLAELATDEKFFYANRTSTNPPAPGRLAQVAGYGSSPIVDYPGQGAYFLDRLEPGVWRLEVMPDAIWVRDPFEKPNPDKQVSVIAWNEWPMRINLPDLGAGFKAVGLNDGNGFNGNAEGSTLSVRPGAYLLTRAGVTTRWRPQDRWENITLKEFVAPAASVDRTYVIHKPVVEAPAGEPLRVTAAIVSPDPVEKVELVAYLPQRPSVTDQRVPPGKRVQPGGGPPDGRNLQTFEMSRTAGFGYSAEIPGMLLRPGTLRYHIAVKGPRGYESFPSAMEGRPTDWDFYGDPWTARVVPAGAPILLFDAVADAPRITADHRGVRYDIVPADRPGASAMAVLVADLELGEHDHSLRFYFKDRINGRGPDLALAAKIVLFGKSATDKPCALQLALVTADGVAYGGTVTVPPRYGALELPISGLRKVRSPNIPHGYPVFIPFWSSVGGDIPLEMNRAESVLVSIGPGIPPAEYGDVHGVDIERIWLE